MANAIYIFSKEELLAWVDRLTGEHEVAAPVKHENAAKFARIRSADQVVWNGPQTVLPPKKFFQPPQEELFGYELQAGEIKTTGEIAAPQLILLGVHPCDLNAIYLMDQVMAENNRDEYYLKKRQAAVLIGVDCMTPCAPEASCLAMEGLDPRGRFDLFLTDLGGEFLVMVGTDKGERLIKGIGRGVESADKKMLRKIVKKRDSLFKKKSSELKPKCQRLAELMQANYRSPVWEENGAKCYSCGACNMVCPTCYCFDVEECVKINLSSGQRKRVWDGCMLADFSVVATGENFREERAERLRHRTFRKLNYLHKKWGQSFCTGCGRCAKACLPKIVNPLDVANAIYTRASKTK